MKLKAWTGEYHHGLFLKKKKQMKFDMEKLMADYTARGGTITRLPPGERIIATPTIDALQKYVDNLTKKKKK